MYRNVSFLCNLFLTITDWNILILKQAPPYLGLLHQPDNSPKPELCLYILMPNGLYSHSGNVAIICHQTLLQNACQLFNVFLLQSWSYITY